MQQGAVIHKSYVRPSLAGAAIFTIVVLHFVISQFISFESKNDSQLTEAINKQVSETEPNYEAKKPDVSESVGVVQPAVLEPEKAAAGEEKIAPKQAVMKQTVIKKLEQPQQQSPAPRESKPQRLRRVEKFLTGA